MTVTLDATFTATVPQLSGACQQRSFAVRVYDARLVASSLPRIASPVTPYIQQSGAPELPRTGPNATTLEKKFEPFQLPSKKLSRTSRLFVALFHVCGAPRPKDVDESGQSIIYDDPLNGSYLGGTFFTLRCGPPPGGNCVYQPE